MGTIITAAFPERTRLWAGEALRVTAAVANDGDGARQVADPVGASPYEYTLVRRDDEADVQTFSAERLALSLTPDPTPPILPEYSLSLAPRSAIDRTDEIAIMRPEGLSVGRWNLFAHYRDANGDRVTSPRAPIEITVPRIDLFDSHVCPFQRTLGTVMAVMDDDGATVILGRESVSEEPQHGVFHRRRRIDRPSRLVDLTTTIDTAEIRGGRWLGWIQGRAMGVLRAFGDRVLSEPSLHALDLRQPRFARPGFQLSDGSGLFVVVGIRDGVYVAQTMRATSKAVEVVASSPLGAKPSGPLRARLRPGGEGAWLSLVWSDATSAGSTLWVRRFDAALQPIGEARELLSTPGALLAWDLDSSANGAIAALSGPSGDGLLVHHRISLDGDHEPTVLARFAPPDLEASAWAVGTTNPSAVLVHGEGKLLFTVPGVVEGYHLIEEGVPATSHLAVVQCGAKGLVGEWVDPSSGSHRAYLRAARR